MSSDGMFERNPEVYPLSPRAAELFAILDQSVWDFTAWCFEPSLAVTSWKTMTNEYPP